MVILTCKELPKRRDYDDYPTLIELCRAALTLLPDSFVPKVILDPGAGTGVWGKAALEKWSAEVWGIELRDLPNPGYYAWIKADYLGTTPKNFFGDFFDLVAGNPPYKYAEAFIRKGLSELKEGGYLLFLLRLSFLEGQARYRGLFYEYPLKSVVVSPRRVSFSGNKKSNETAYAVYLWQKGYQGQTGLGWLDWNYAT